jgi:hypothetical protein
MVNYRLSLTSCSHYTQHHEFYYKHANTYSDTNLTPHDTPPGPWAPDNTHGPSTVRMHTGWVLSTLSALRAYQVHSCYTAVTLLLHCYDTVVTLLLHCYDTVVTLLLHCRPYCHGEWGWCDRWWVCVSMGRTSEGRACGGVGSLSPPHRPALSRGSVVRRHRGCSGACSIVGPPLSPGWDGFGGKASSVCVSRARGSVRGKNPFCHTLTHS